MHITIKYEIPEPKGDNPVGVDVGINKLLVASNGFINGYDVNIGKHFKELRRSLQNKGTSSEKRKLKQLSGREHQYVNTIFRLAESL